MELKVSALQTRKLISHTNYLEDIIIDNRKDDYTSDNQFKEEIDALADDDKKNIDVAYFQWERVKQSEISKNTGKIKGDKTMRMAQHLPAEELRKETLEGYEAYKNHLKRNSVIKNELRQVRLEAMEEDDLAVLHVDWAEQHKLTEVKEIQTVFAYWLLLYKR